VACEGPIVGNVSRFERHWRTTIGLHESHPPVDQACL